MSSFKFASNNKAVQRVVNDALKAGWTIFHNAGHAKLRSPDGTFKVMVARTPRDDNSAKALAKDIRRGSGE